MPFNWKEKRRPLVLAALVLVAIVSVVMYIRREPRRLDASSRGIFVVPKEVGPSFARDSMLVVTLGSHEHAQLPIRVTWWHDGSGVTLSERSIRRALVEDVEKRRGARVDVEHWNGVLSLPAPGVTVRYDFHVEGHTRTDVELHCLLPADAGKDAGSFRHVVAVSRTRLLTEDGLTTHFREMLRTAAGARCPDGSRAFAPVVQDSAARTTPPGSVALEATQQASATAPGDATAEGAAPAQAPPPVMLVPVVQASDTTRSTSPDVDSGRVAAITRARSVGSEIVRLISVPDSLEMRVGEKMQFEFAHILTALRADGSAALRFTPLYHVEDRDVLRVGANGLEALAAGVARVSIRVLSQSTDPLAAGGPEATLLVKVKP